MMLDVFSGNFGMRFNTVFWATGGDEYTVSSIVPVSHVNTTRSHRRGCQRVNS